MVYDVETLLAAFQASFIYIIVQGEGTSSLTCEMQHSGLVQSILNNCAVGLSQNRTSQHGNQIGINIPRMIRI